MERFHLLKNPVQLFTLSFFYLIYLVSVVCFNYTHAANTILVLVNNKLLFLLLLFSINILLTLPAIWLITKFTAFTYKLSSIEHRVDKYCVFLTCSSIFIIELYSKLIFLSLYAFFKFSLLFIILFVPVITVFVVSILDKSLIKCKKITAYIPLLLYFLVDIVIVFLID
ncbi:hypothetical protein CJI51_05080 [Bifidobacteriaceae bacterium WP021]|nr:hypothetical protein CJI51_05080 [Bifidobacteriaceae bacterium WP021]